LGKTWINISERCENASEGYMIALYLSLVDEGQQNKFEQVYYRYKNLISIVTAMVMLSLSVLLATDCQSNVQAKSRTINAKKCGNTKYLGVIYAHQTLKMKLKGVKSKNVQWHISNKKVAVVTKNGILKGKKKGVVKVTAKVKNKKYTCKVKVKNGKTLSGLDVKKSTLKQGIFLTDRIYKNKNILISPLSLNMVLGMIANGASGDVSPKGGEGYGAPTVYINPRWEIETYLGKSVDKYNKYAQNILSNSDNKVKISNSVWYRNTNKLNDEFANAVKKYYAADIYGEAFDTETLSKINNWASEKTDGKIKHILDGIDSKDQAYIIDALLFKAQWDQQIESYNVKNKKFTKFDGSKVKVKMMEDSSNYYYENDYATAFEKIYEGGEYSFIGILPKVEGEFNLENLDITTLLKNKKKHGSLVIKFPKFSYECSQEMQKILPMAGINSIFSPSYGPLQNMFTTDTENAIYVSGIQQFCKIDLDRKGTEAAAVTIATVKETSAFVSTQKSKSIILNRPFAYLIRNNKTNDILFIGKVIDPTAKK
jgi:serpin B